jgi:hypothetical protein
VTMAGGSVDVLGKKKRCVVDLLVVGSFIFLKEESLLGSKSGVEECVIISLSGAFSLPPSL